MNQIKPQYAEIGIITDPDSKSLVYSDVINLKDPGEFVVGWIEFDYNIENEYRHVKIRGYINRYIKIM